MFRTPARALLAVAAVASLATVAPAHADVSPVHGTVYVSIPTGDPTQSSADANPTRSDGVSVTPGDVEGIVGSAAIDPTTCSVTVDRGTVRLLPGTDGVQGVTGVRVGGCAGSDFAADLTSVPGARGSYSGTIGGESAARIKVTIDFTCCPATITITISF